MLIEIIEKDLIKAIKTKNETSVSTLRILKSAIHNWQIANKRDPNDDDILDIIQKEIKSRRDSVNLYKQGNRAELAEKEEKEIAILQKYLPEQISGKEVRLQVKEVISQTNASGPQDMGKVMAVLIGEFKGRADGAMVSQIVKEELMK